MSAAGNSRSKTGSPLGGRLLVVLETHPRLLDRIRAIAPIGEDSRDSGPAEFSQNLAFMMVGFFEPAHRYHTPMRDLADHMFELNGGVVDAELLM